MRRIGNVHLLMFIALHWVCPPVHAISQKALGEKVEKFTSMTDKFNDKFVKPFNEDGAKALDVLKNLAKDPMNFVAISSLIGSALSFIALSADATPLTVGAFNKAMEKLHGAIGDLQRHLSKRLDQLEKLMVELSVKSEIATPLKQMLEKITLFASSPRIHLGQLEASCNATGWTPSDLRNKLDSLIEYIPVLSKRGASTRAGLEEVTEYFYAMLMDLQFITGACNGIAYKRTAASASEIQRDASHHGLKMKALEAKIKAQDGKIMGSYFPDAAYEIAREIMKNGGSNEDMANKISAKLSKDYDPDVFVVGIYDATKGWDNHGISEHSPSSTLFKLDHQESGGLFGKHLLIHRASGDWGFKPKCDSGGVVDKLTDKITTTSFMWGIPSTRTIATRDLRNAMNYVREKCKDSVSFVAFVRFGNGLRVHGSMPDDGWQFENVKSENTYSMVIGLGQSDQRVHRVSTKSSQTAVKNVQIDIGTLIMDIRAAFIEPTSDLGHEDQGDDDHGDDGSDDGSGGDDGEDDDEDDGGDDGGDDSGNDGGDHSGDDSGDEGGDDADDDGGDDGGDDSGDDGNDDGDDDGGDDADDDGGDDDGGDDGDDDGGDDADDDGGDDDGGDDSGDEGGDHGGDDAGDEADDDGGDDSGDDGGGDNGDDAGDNSGDDGDDDGGDEDGGDDSGDDGGDNSGEDGGA